MLISIQTIRRRGASCALIGVLALASCSVEAAGPDWVDLTEGFDPVKAFKQSPNPEVWGNSLEVGYEGSLRRGVWLHTDAAAEDWEDLGHGFWRLARKRILQEDWSGNFPPSMTSGGLPVEPLDGARVAYWGSALDNYPPGRLPASYRMLADDLPSFALGRRWVYWLGQPGGQGPGRTRLSTWLDFGPRMDREARLEWGSVSCRGIPLLTGIPQTIEIPQAGMTRLDFASATWGEGEEGTAVFKLYFRDEVIWKHTQTVEASEHIDFHTLVLPRSARVGSELRFELEGPATIGGILTPRIYSLDWAQHRRNQPNLVMYTAGSFRADNLVALGGDVRIAPNLNALATEGVCFTQAYAPSTNALLSNAAIVTGRYAQQIPLDDPTSVLPSQVVTLAEHLHSQGYRTVAITDGGVSSRRFGFAQGFEWFEESLDAIDDPNGERWTEQWPMLESVERILNSGDGRPLFLYVHSQRLQWPFRVSERLRKDRKGRPKGQRGRAKGIEDAVESIGPGVPRKRVSLEKARAAYRGASYDSDWAFGEFRGLLEAFGTLQDSYLVFLGDHGESLGAHGVVAHGQSVWQAEAHIPLVISGPNMQGAKVDHPVSLTTLAASLVGLLGLEPQAEFAGPHLMEEDPDHGVFVFQGFTPEDSARYLALIHGGYKAIFRWNDRFVDQDDIVGVFDVVRDPKETDPVEVTQDVASSLVQYLHRVLPGLLHPTARNNRVGTVGR
ncbi:MAG: sulfatase-like hydrolase/transferase [Planctomycetota bacterium]|nr:sulfatase-like hydrolase/transferase [Planctomycetota bacterium]